MTTFLGLISFAIFIALIVGLVKPEYVKLDSRKQVGKWLGGGLIIFLIFSGIVAPSEPASESSNSEVANNHVEESSNVSENNTTSEDRQEEVAPETRTVSEDESQPNKVNQTDNQNTSPVSSEAVSQRNAVRKAKSYLDYSAFSRNGLVEQLEYDQFSHADAVYGADNSGADWHEQAAQKAKTYMEYSAFSRNGLIEQLKYDGFTQAQAEYGADAVGL